MVHGESWLVETGRSTATEKKGGVFWGGAMISSPLFFWQTGAGAKTVLSCGIQNKDVAAGVSSLVGVGIGASVYGTFSNVGIDFWRPTTIFFD